MTTCGHCGEIASSEAARYCEACGHLLEGATPIVAPSGQRARPASTETRCDARLAAVSDIGLRHATNQDRGTVMRRADGLTLMAVADGVSSSDVPERAAAAAVDAVAATFAAAEAIIAPVELARACVAAAAVAVTVVPRVDTADDLDPPEATLVVAVVGGADAGIAWVGDSRAYLIDNREATALTVDDSWAAMAVVSGQMSREAAARDPRAHAILQCLGMPDGHPDIHTRILALPPTATLLLCSDGLWNSLDDPGAMATAFARAALAGDATAICHALVAKANADGGHDNITVAVRLPE